MSDIYKTSFRLNLTGNLNQELLAVSRSFRGLDKQIAETQGKLNRLTLGKGIFESTLKLKKEFGAIAAAAVHSNQTIDGSFAAMAGKMKLDLRGVKTTTAEVAGAMARDFKGVFSGADQQISGLNRQIAEMSSKMRGMQFGSGSGSGGGRSIRHAGSSALDVAATGPSHSGIFAGLNVEHSTKGLLEANGELQRQVNIYRLSGASAAAASAAKDAVYKSAIMVPDVGVAEQMKLYRELVGVTGDEKGSIQALPDAAKTMSVMGAITGRHSDEDMKRIFKFIELRGVAIDEATHKIDVTKFGSELNYATKAMVASQGLINSNDMLQFAKQAGPMAKGMSGDQLFSTMLASMEDMGGARSGTALTAVGRQFLGGIMTGNKADRLDELHLLNKEGVDRSGAHAAITDPTKGIKGYEVLTKQGFGAFMDQIIRPALINAGITDRQAQNNELYRSLSTDTARRQVGLFLSGQEQVAMVAGRFKQAMGGTEGYDKIFGNGEDFQTSSKAFHEAIGTLKTALGDAAGVAPMLMTFARAIATVADALKDRPALASIATLGGVGGSAALMGYGALKTVTGFGLPAAATQLSAAAVALDAAALKIGGASVAADASKLAGAAGLGAFGIGGIVAGGAVAYGGIGYLNAQEMLKQHGGNGMDPATGLPLDSNPMSGMAPEKPWLRDWFKSWFSAPGAKEAAEAAGKQGAVTVTEWVQDGPLRAGGHRSGARHSRRLPERDLKSRGRGWRSKRQLRRRRARWSGQQSQLRRQRQRLWFRLCLRRRPRSRSRRVWRNEPDGRGGLQSRRSRRRSRRPRRLRSRHGCWR